MNFQFVREKAGVSWRWTKNAFRVSRDWCSRQWTAIRPGPEVRRASMAGAALITLAWAAYMGTQVRFGFGPLGDAAICVVAAAVVLVLACLAVALALWIVRKLPLWPTAALLVAAALIGNFWPSSAASGAALVLTAAGIAATCASLYRGGFRQMARQRQVITIALLVLLVAFAGLTTW